MAVRTPVQVTTAVYEGPFDLLLQLILKEDVDIYEIDLAKIVDAYLAELERMQELDLDVATEFLLIAATLVELKSRRLLPGSADVDLDEEFALWEERDLLLARLIECKTFKDVAGVFAVLAESADRSFARVVGPDERFAALSPDLLEGTSVRRLQSAAIRALTPRPEPVVDLFHVNPIRLTVAEAIGELVSELPRLGPGIERQATTACGEPAVDAAGTGVIGSSGKDPVVLEAIEHVAIITGSERDIQLGFVQLALVAVGNVVSPRDFIRRRRHQLHQTTRAGRRERFSPEGAFLTRECQHQLHRQALTLRLGLERLAVQHREAGIDFVPAARFHHGKDRLIVPSPAMGKMAGGEPFGFGEVPGCPPPFAGGVEFLSVVKQLANPQQRGLRRQGGDPCFIRFFFSLHYGVALIQPVAGEKAIETALGGELGESGCRAGIGFAQELHCPRTPVTPARLRLKGGRQLIDAGCKRVPVARSDMAPQVPFMEATVQQVAMALNLGDHFAGVALIVEGANDCGLIQQSYRFYIRMPDEYLILGEQKGLSRNYFQCDNLLIHYWPVWYILLPGLRWLSCN